MFSDTALQIDYDDIHPRGILVDAAVPNPDRFVCRAGQAVFDRFFYVVEGVFTITLKNRTQITVNPGNILYLPADTKYVSHWDRTKKGYYISFIFKLYNPAGQQISLFNTGMVAANDKDGELYSLFKEALDEYKKQEKFSSLKMTSYFYQLLCRIFRIMEVQSIKKQKETSEIYKAIVFLNDNYMSAVTTEELAQLCGLNCSKFRKLFKLSKQMSPMKYKTRLRMTYAQKLLKSGFYTVTEVSTIMNSADLSHFNKLYRLTFGKNPSEDLPQID